MSTSHPHTHQAASRLAQLLAHTINEQAPVTAKINETVRQEHMEAWLEGLEQHISKQIGPLLQKVLDNSNMPPEVRPLFEEVIRPKAQFGSVLTQVFLYGIVQSLIGVSVQPFLQGVSNDVFTQAVASGISVPPSPATIATAAGRGLNLGDPPTVTVPQWAYEYAAMSGVSADDIALQASLVGIPPAFQELLEMRRRGIITDAQLAQGLREGDFRDDWIQYAVQLIQGWPTPTDFVRAAVQEQMPYSDARDWAQKTGLDVSTALPLATGSTTATPDMFGLLFATAGRPPGPQELARMTQRGIINKDGTGADATTFQQGIAESDVKTKWTDALYQLAQYVPPPREVGTLLERGAIDKDQAIQYWMMGGVPDALAQGYAYIAEQQHVGQDKLLAKGNILTAYFDGIVSKDQATSLLDDLGYRGDVAAEMLAIQDFRRQIQAINNVVTRIRSLYEGFKLSEADALQALTEVGIPNDQAQALLQTWLVLRIQPVHLPSADEIGKAVKYGTLDQAEALIALSRLGYEPRDAAIVLSATAEVPVTPLPAAGDTVTG